VLPSLQPEKEAAHETNRNRMQQLDASRLTCGRRGKIRRGLSFFLAIAWGEIPRRNNSLNTGIICAPFLQFARIR
jgi:hypothetical protein